MTYEGIELPLNLGAKGLQESLGSMDAVLDVLHKINQTVGDISGKMDNLGADMKKDFRAAEQGAEGLIDKLGKIGLAIQGIRGIASSVLGAIQPIFDEGLSRDSSMAMLETLLPKGADVKGYAEGLRKEMMSGLYGAGTVTNAAQTMMSFGIDSNKTKDMLKAISDIAGGDAQRFNSLVLSFSQATSLGKLQGQDKLQMIGAGFNPLTQIAKDLGKSVAEVDEMMGKGQISADMLADAFKNATSEGGTFFGATKKQMAGVNGLLKQYKAQIADLFAEMYEQLRPLVEAVMPKVVGAIQLVTETIKGQHPVLSALAAIVGTIAVALGAYAAVTKISAAWTALLTAKQWLLNIAMNANPVGLVVAALAAMVAIVTICIQKYDEWGAALLLVTGPLGLIVNAVMALRRNWDAIVESFKTGGILAGLNKIAQVLMDAILYPLQQLLETLGLDSLAGKLKGLRASMGLNMGPAGITPGEAGNSTMGGATGGGGAQAAQSTMAKGASAVATGGTRNTSITISMGSLVHQINYSGGIEKNSRETTQDLQEALLRVLNAAANTAG